MPEPQRCPVARMTWAGWIIKAKAYMRRKVKQCYCTRCQLWVWLGRALRSLRPRDRATGEEAG